MLIIENANVGWATIQVAIDRNYSKSYIIPPRGDQINLMLIPILINTQRPFTYGSWIYYVFENKTNGNRKISRIFKQIKVLHYNQKDCWKK